MRSFARRERVDLPLRVDYYSGMSLIRGLFWLVLFVFFTFCFVVLFEYGTHDFASGFKTELARVKALVVKETEKPGAKAHK
jgi:hypothetical protein